MNNEFKNSQNDIGNVTDEQNSFSTGNYTPQEETSTYYYDYTKQDQKKQKKKSYVFPIISFVASIVALSLAVVLVVVLMSENNPVIPPASTESPQTQEFTLLPTDTLIPDSTNPEQEHTIDYTDNQNWTNPGNIVSDDAIVNATYKTVDTVVAITVTASSLYGEAQGAGSGVVIAEEKDKDGKAVASYIITNHHVIDGANGISVTLTNGDTISATLIGSDSQTDIAVIKVKAIGLRIAEMGDSSKILLGETVIAIGNPLGELANTVTNGIISGLERDINVEGTEMKLLQTNAEVSPGNSGGGLFNLNGELIGVVNAKSSGDSVEGLGFAIPINTAKEIANDLILNGYVTGRCQIGVQGAEVTNANKNYYKEDPLYQYIYDYYYANNRQVLPGFYITDDTGVNYANSENKFEYGDIIAAIEGVKVSDGASITSALMAHEVGQTVTITVYRLVETETTRFGQTFKTTQIKTFDVSIVLGEKTS